MVHADTQVRTDARLQSSQHTSVRTCRLIDPCPQRSNRPVPGLSPDTSSSHQPPVTNSPRLNSHRLQMKSAEGCLPSSVEPRDTQLALCKCRCESSTLGCQAVLVALHLGLQLFELLQYLLLLLMPLGYCHNAQFPFTALHQRKSSQGGHVQPQSARQWKRDGPITC